MLGLIKYLGLALLFLLGVGQTFLNIKFKRNWKNLHVVKATIVTSKLVNRNELDGTRTYQANIEYTYEYEGAEYTAKSPVLRSPQLFPNYNFEHELLSRYKKGDVVEARIYPKKPQVAFLEVMPLSKKSAIAIPILIVLYIAFVFGYGWGMVNMFNYNHHKHDPYYYQPSK